jgi:hypothetical protein
MILLSVVGLVRTLFIILGVILLLRLIGKVMIARRVVQEHSAEKERERKQFQANEQAKRNFGKTTLSKINKDQLRSDDFVDFEEIKEND